MADHTVTRTYTDEEWMALRCAEEGHRWEDGISLLFQRTRICKWCHYREVLR